MKKRMVGMAAFLLLLSGCESIALVDGTLTFKADSLSERKDLAEFTAGAGEQIEIPYEVTIEGKEGDIYLIVEDDDGYVMAEQAIEGNAEGVLSFEAPHSGEYDLELDGYSPTELEVYFEVEDLENIDTD
ncbi:MAG TPA: hypothetical protein VEY51_01840 [Chondromyces sp.]|nr:hypothetical protein [Chondromyces sp.]